MIGAFFKEKVAHDKHVLGSVNFCRLERFFWFAQNFDPSNKKSIRYGITIMQHLSMVKPGGGRGEGGNCSPASPPLNTALKCALG